PRRPRTSAGQAPPSLVPSARAPILKMRLVSGLSSAASSRGYRTVVAEVGRNCPIRNTVVAPFEAFEGFVEMASGGPYTRQDPHDGQEFRSLRSQRGRAVVAR